MKRSLSEDLIPILQMLPNQSLGKHEVAAYRARYGSNHIAEQPPSRITDLVRDTAADPMLWFLLATSGLFGMLGQYTDMAVLLVAILPLIGMDFYLHRRTQASIEGLRNVLAATAVVVRAGAECQIAAEALVPGDLVKIQAGESIPADGVIISGENIQVEESSLTGEAYPVSKHAHGEGQFPDEAAWVFAGTRLLTGTAGFRVMYTGSDTIFGEIVRSAVNGPPGRTPLQNAVARLVKLLLAAAAVLCLLLAVVRLEQGFGLVDALLSAAMLAVAAIPEEFPVVLTFFLGVGVYRLARAKVLVRRGVAVENIGRVSVICSDKTGTITEGQLRFSQACPAEGVTDDQLMHFAALASRTDSGDPLDDAILKRAPVREHGWSLIHVFPFTEGRRRETACWQDRSGSVLAVTKGAPETILGLCNLDAGVFRQWHQTVQELSQQGHKVIACARAQLAGDPAGEPSDGFEFAGLIAISDPVRPGVRLAVEEALAAGIQVVMVTGDHPDTARAIANDAGLRRDSLTILGDDLGTELARMTAGELKRIGIIARASPAQKVQLVEAFQRQDEIVAVTGDGVNDAPALRAADIGIAMGLRGTRSAREVSAMVLMDDNFKTIISAIGEGRQLFQNLRMSFAFLLMIHLPFVTTAALIPFLGYPLLYLPAHIVWLELLIHPAAILAFQSQAAPLSRQGPARRSASFFNTREWGVITVTGVVLACAVFAVFIWTMEQGETPESARSMALVCLICGLAMLVAMLKRAGSVPAIVVLSLSVASGLMLVQWAPAASVLKLSPLPWPHWVSAAVIGALPAMGSGFLRQKPALSVWQPARYGI